MNKLLVLTKILLKNSIDLWGKARKNKAQMAKRVLLYLLFMIAFAPLVGSFGYLVGVTYQFLAPLGQEGVILSLTLSVVSMVIFFFGLFYVTGVFYFSQDIEYLLPLPFKPWEILGAKFLIALIYEYLTELLFLLPVLVVFGLKSGGGVYYYFTCLVIFLALPVIPLVLASLIMMTLMRFTRWVKNKDRFRLVAGILGMCFGVGFNIVFQRYAGTTGQGEELAKLMMEGNNSLLNISLGIFPQTKLGAFALVSPAGEGWTQLLLFVLVTVLALILFAFVGQAFYFHGAMGMSEISAKRKKMDSSRLRKGTVRHSVFKSYILKELRLLFRTPVYFMNCVLMNFLWPVFLLIPFFVQPGFREQMKFFGGFMQNPATTGYVLAGVFAVSVFVTAANAVTATAISREGGNIFVTKYLPVDFKKQILAKVLSGVVLGLTGMILIILAANLLIPMPAYLILLLILSGTWGVFFSSLAGMAVDLHFPKLHWENEQKAVKQNLNVMIMMMVAAVFAGLTVFGAVKLHLGLWPAFTGIIGLWSVINLLLYRYLMTRGVKLFAALGDEGYSGKF